MAEYIKFEEEDKKTKMNLSNFEKAIYVIYNDDYYYQYFIIIGLLFWFVSLYRDIEILRVIIGFSIGWVLGEKFYFVYKLTQMRRRLK